MSIVTIKFRNSSSWTKWRKSASGHGLKRIGYSFVVPLDAAVPVAAGEPFVAAAPVAAADPFGPVVAPVGAEVAPVGVDTGLGAEGEATVVCEVGAVTGAAGLGAVFGANGVTAPVVEVGPVSRLVVTASLASG